MVAEGGEGENPLLFSLTTPKRGGGWGGGGGGVGGVSRLRFPPGPHPPKQPFQPTPTPSPGSQGGFCGENAPGGPGPKPWGPGPQASGDLGPGSRHSHRLTSCKPATITRASSLQHFSRWAGPKPLRIWPTSPPVLIGS